MCGITGLLFARADSAADELETTIRRMRDAMVHRGPDDAGAWIDARAGIGFGHRRLSIVDLSPNGKQPMWSTSGRYCVTFNGEIYNFLDLRRQLESSGHQFRGGSDTEVMLAAFEEWGVEAALRRFNGMFAFGLWDAQQQTLHLARDRCGEKPLYYGLRGQVLVFASELKAILAYAGSRPPIHRGALKLLIRYGYVPAPFTIFEDIFKLPPGKLLTVTRDRIARPAELRAAALCDEDTPWLRSYWTLAAPNRREPLTDAAVAADRLDELLHAAIRRQRIADVPLGAFLSAGIDSSTVVSIMQQQSTIPVRTFTIGFEDQAFDEAGDARRIAQHLGTDHTEIYVSAADALDVVPALAGIYDEPFADASQIPTYLVSRIARRHVTVCLSGDGGDELFAGYNRYQWTLRIWSRLERLPLPLRRAAAGAIALLPERAWNGLYGATSHFLPANLRQRHVGTKMLKLAAVLGSRNLAQMYDDLLSGGGELDPLCTATTGRMPMATDRVLHDSHVTPLRQLLYWDMHHYLPNDNLAKVDRASMAVSLETRLPLLDRDVVEFAWSLDDSLKVSERQGKWLLRRVLSRYLPASLTDRPKSGFSVPVADWLRISLREWTDELLSEERLRRHDYFDVKRVRALWDAHRSGKVNAQTRLWSILMFQAWHAQWME